MDFDRYLASLPLVGNGFRKSYAFWRSHIAVANITHIALGLGIALSVFTDLKNTSIFFIAFAFMMHIIAYLKGK